MPAMKHQPAALRLASGQRLVAHATASSAECMVHLVAHADFEDAEHIRRDFGLERVGAKGP